MSTWAAVVLAAGQGVRMRSRLPKVLHLVAGKAMLHYVVSAALHNSPSRLLVVVPPESMAIRASLDVVVEFVEQSEPRGTADALACVLAKVDPSVDALMVLSGDAPLLSGETTVDLLSKHRATGAAITFLVSKLCPPDDMGRVIRDSTGNVSGILEGVEGGLQGEEVNAGAYVFDLAWLREHLKRLAPHSNGETFLTDLIDLAYDDRVGVETLESQDRWEALGVNTRVQMALAETAMRDRICQRWMREGVSMLDPSSTFIEADVEIGQDTVIYPQTQIRGRTRIGRECEIGSQSFLFDSVIGDRCSVRTSTLEGVICEDDVHIGPYSHLRPGTYLECAVYIGNHAEVKNSRLGRGTHMGHFGYVGDATIGPSVNIGAGVITCNYDGRQKNRTVIEENAFIGSSCMLVAPIRVGAGAITGAGSVITKDVPANTVVAGVPARKVRSKVRDEINQRPGPISD
jgi:bifunctional UDP-N-acetylglucosamine pyrophosphorylase/glucosamine-1-phosphate N-acetyltransferase